MDSSTPFNLVVFTDSTKNLCTCSALSIFIIVLFVISPLCNFVKLSAFMKLVVLMLLIYTLYLNHEQTKLLREARRIANSEQVNSQLGMNILCSYIFTAFIGLLFIYVIRSLF
jgi:undecaprenyl pyrophosphate phosphatase UppP